CRNVAKRSAERLLADANAAARTNLMRPPPDLLLRRGQLGPALADERMQLGFEVSAEVDQRRQRALSEVRMRRRRHAGDAHAGRPDGHLQVRIVALVALERPALADPPDVRPLVSGLDGVLDEVRPQAHARVELVLDLVQRGALVLEGHVVVDYGYLRLRLSFAAAGSALAAHSDSVCAGARVELAVEHRVRASALHR